MTGGTLFWFTHETDDFCVSGEDTALGQVSSQFKNARQGVSEENQTGADQPVPRTAKLKISPGSHSARTSNGRQHTSQSVVNRCVRVLVSITSSKVWPQYGH